MADYLSILHEVREFAAWKQSYEADAPRRQAAGLREVHLMRELANPNLVGLLFEVSDVGKARSMAQSPELAAAMSKAGVIGAPVARFRRGTYRPTQAATFATLTVDVKDFDVAMKAYAMDAADRGAAGLTDLGVLQLADKPTNVVLIWAVGDVARATTFFDSPGLAAQMVNNAGVVGSPERHFWRA